MISNNRKPSRAHRNRTMRNWLAYDIGDRFLLKYSPAYNGVMYDLGCGEAPYKEFFSQYVEKYVGVDWPGSRHRTEETISADLNKELAIDSEVADCVVAISVLEHLCEPQTMLNEAYRILRPGGSLVLQVPWQWWIHERPHDYFRYTPYGLEYMLTKAGFVEIESEPQSGFFSMWILKFNYFTGRLIRGRKPIRWILTGLFVPVWTLGQYIAPILDRLDRDWSAETIGYFVSARKR